MFMPQRPYMPPGALAGHAGLSLAGDGVPRRGSGRRLRTRRARAICRRELDRSANWDSELTSEEAQRLAFARLLLHKPRWVCIDEALDSLEEADRAAILAHLRRRACRDAAVISLGHRDLREGFSDPRSASGQIAGRSARSRLRPVKPERRQPPLTSNAPDPTG